MLDGLGRPFRAKQVLTASGVVAYYDVAALGGSWVRVIMNALLILLAPFIWSQNELQTVWLGMCYGDLAGMPEHLDRAFTYPMEVQGLSAMAPSCISSPGEILQILQGSHSFPAFCLWSLSLIYYLEAVQ